MTLEAFHFLRPLWLLGLLAVPWLLWMVARTRRRAGDWERVIDPELMPHLLVTPSASRRHRSGVWLGVLATGVIVALAGPAWERIETPVMARDDARALVLSLSESMLAGDQRPDRLTRARLKLADLISASRGQHLALVVFAGDAFTVAPVTDDGNTLRVQLDVLHPDLMPVPGARPDLGIELAARLLEDAQFGQGEILLLSDYADPRAEAAAAEARRAGMRVSVLAFGTEEGAPVPLSEGGFQRDAGGNIVLPRLDVAALRAVARAGGGRFLHARGDHLDVTRLMEGEGGTGGEGESQRTLESFRDRGPWLTVLLLPLALIAWRRGVLLLLAVLLPWPQPADAFSPDGLWQRRDQQAHQALIEGDHARARALAVDPARRGAAAFREGDHEAAIAAFSEGDSARDRYNLGNALAAGGRFEEALAAWEEALRLDPALDDARANIDSVRDWLERQPPQQGEGDGENRDERSEQGEDSNSGQQDGEPDSGNGNGESEGDPQQSADDDAGSRDGPADGNGEGDPDSLADASATEDAEGMGDTAEALARELDQALSEAEPGEATRDPAEREAEEQRQMIEQWLRRIPDDPGALLRRKFAVEHRRRQAERGRP